MRTGWVLLCLLLPVSTFATTLRLSGDIDLLVLDGKKVSSLLLRGAESIELDNGPHQVVFRVEKMVAMPNQNRQLYVSPPLIANFNSQLIGQVNFSLPRLETVAEAQAFTSLPHVSLLDGNAIPIPVKLDILATTQVGEDIDYEKATESYNQARKLASDAQFSNIQADDSTLLSKTNELDNPAYPSQTLTEQRLKYWFQQADPDTRHRFLEWAKSQPSS